ncbi:MAG: hypothetical protein MRY57_03700 [Candidatus Pacebacteria bacterium]|nr:hypothetical protein [Candidatus Paceibacterota bacterium]
MKSERTLTLLGIGGLVLFNFWFLFTDAQPWIINSINILFHEAGHWIFFIFGQFLYVLGGTLGEILMPTIFIISFWMKDNIPGQAFSWWWLSTAFYSVSIYVSDARAQRLELIGGPGGHDWFYLLGQTRLLDYDIFIGRIFVFLSLLATLYVAWLGYRYWQLGKGKIIS